MRDIFERMLYVIWLMGITISLTLTVFLAEFSIIGLCVTNHIPQELLVIACAIPFLPIFAMFKKFGNDHLNFKKHELDGDYTREENSGIFHSDNQIMAELEKYVKLIEESSGWQRQVHRRETKKFILDNKKDFNDVTMEYVRDNLGYLC